MLGGSGSGDSSSIIRGGGKDLTRETGQVKEGESNAKKSSYTLRALKEEQRKAEKSRLEQLNKQFGTSILATESTVKAAGGRFASKRLGETDVRGHRGDVVVYRIDPE